MWCNKMFVSLVLSDTFGLPSQWSMADTCVKLVRKHVELAAERNFKFKKPVAVHSRLLLFVCQHQNVISVDRLSSTWVRCIGRKCWRLPWEDTAVEHWQGDYAL